MAVQAVPREDGQTLNEHQHCQCVSELTLTNERLRAEVEKPIPMYLRCTRCSLPHIDRDEWTTRPHKTHLCEGCGHEWRISDRPTVGVEVLASQFGRDKE